MYSVNKQAVRIRVIIVIERREHGVLLNVLVRADGLSRKTWLFREQFTDQTPMQNSCQCTYEKSFISLLCTDHQQLVRLFGSFPD